MATFLKRRVRVQGFIIFDDYGSRYSEFQKQMSEWYKAGKIKCVEDIVEGLDRAPEAFMGLLQGKNFGKLIVRVSVDTTPQ
jgi:NADPH-dependent curcumin reductase CurA